MNNLYIGQILKCLNDETVIITDIRNDKIIVEYKKKLYERPLSIIGNKLFIMENDIVKFDVKSCKSCIYMRSDDCFGQKEICDKFKPCPNVDKELINSWPKYMLGPYG
jgi:hypothetical protein